MGRVAYQSMASYFPTATDDPNADVLNAAFSSGLELDYRRHH